MNQGFSDPLAGLACLWANWVLARFGIGLWLTSRSFRLGGVCVSASAADTVAAVFMTPVDVFASAVEGPGETVAPDVLTLVGVFASAVDGLGETVAPVFFMPAGVLIASAVDGSDETVAPVFLTYLV